MTKRKGLFPGLHRKVAEQARRKAKPTKREERAAVKRAVRTFIRGWTKRGDVSDVRNELEVIVAEAIDAHRVFYR